MSDTIYKIEMEGDALYYAATSEDEAYARFYPTFPVPRNLLKFTRLKKSDVPAGEEIL